MKIKIVLLAIFVSNVSNCSFVLVHLGKQLPPYIFTCISQIRLFNPVEDLYLIAEEEALSEYIQKKLIKKNVHIIYTSTLEKTSHHEIFLKNSRLDTSFKEGFWLKTSERFFYIESLMKHLDLHDVIHLENDVLIYFALSDYINSFDSYNNIAAIFDADDRCIASLIYFKNGTSIEFLTRFIANKSSKNFNDMEVIALFKREMGDQYINNLPIITPEFVRIQPLKNKLGHTTQTPHLYYNNIELFNSIFDAAALGQYVGGTDPMHGHKPGFVNERCLFDASRLTIIWKEDYQKRKIPYAEYEGKEVKINNLHIHCKNLKLFKS